MSNNFTYNAPDNENYLAGLLILLNSKGETKLYELLKNAICTIDASRNYSRDRWNAVYTTVYFHIPFQDFYGLNNDDESKARLISYCDIVMPKEIGYDVKNVEFSPRLDSGPTKSLESDLEEFSNPDEESDNYDLPEDILRKGKEMSKVYLYLYAIENYLRLFIEKVCTTAYGDQYFSKLTTTKTIRETVNGRRRTEEKNRWISVRGSSDLFYLDFIELGALIQNNWSLFQNYFPEQSWISSKLNDLYGIRNLVAHNSYVGEHERDLLRVTFRSIIRQLKCG